MTDKMTPAEVAVFYNLLPQEVKQYARSMVLGEETRCKDCGLLTDTRTGYIHTTSKGCLISVCRVCYAKNQWINKNDLVYIDWNG